MKHKNIYLSLLVIFLLAACGPSPELIMEQTANAATAIASSWTPTPLPTPTPVIYNLKITVENEEGTVIPDAKIIMDKTYLTDEMGVWSDSLLNPEFDASIWAQGYKLQKFSTELEPGENEINVKVEADSYGLKLEDLQKEGYELIFVEDFQDGILDCSLFGNAGLFPDENLEGNNSLLVDLRNIEDSFWCEFGPTGLRNAIIETDFYYPEIRYNDFKNNEFYYWQGYGVSFRDGFDVEGYPLSVPWGPTIQIRDYSEDEWKYPLTSRLRIDENTWYTLSTNWQDQKVEVCINGSVRFRYLNAPETINVDRASVFAFSQAYIQFDNIKMWVPLE